MRNSAIFKDISDEKITYSYNNILNISNNDIVWETYPPLDQPGCLDDDLPDVKLYFDKRAELCNKLNSTISFPYIPETFTYHWDFELKDFVKEV